MRNTHIDLGQLIINSLKSIKHDKSYLIPFLLPVLWLIIAFLHFWLIMRDLIIYIQGFQYTQNPASIGFFASFIEQNIISIIVFGIIHLIILYVLFIFASSSIIKKYQIQRTGEKLEVTHAFSKIIGKIPRIIGTIILAGLIIMSPLLLFILMSFGILNNVLILVGISLILLFIVIIPWIYIALRLSLVLQTCVMEDLSPVNSIKRCWKITKGNVLNIFIVSFIVGVISLIFSIPFQIIGSFGYPIAQFIGLILVYTLIWPFGMLAMSALYFELRPKEIEKNINSSFQNDF